MSMTSSNAGVYGLSTSMLTKPSTNEKTSFRLAPMWSQSGHWDWFTGSGCVGSNSAAIQHMLTATATTFTGCCSLELR